MLIRSAALSLYMVITPMPVGIEQQIPVITDIYEKMGESGLTDQIAYDHAVIQSLVDTFAFDKAASQGALMDWCFIRYSKQMDEADETGKHQLFQKQTVINAMFFHWANRNAGQALDSKAVAQIRTDITRSIITPDGIDDDMANPIVCDFMVLYGLPEHGIDWR